MSRRGACAPTHATTRSASARSDDIPQGELIGNGHLAITIDPGEEMERYQGIVELTGHGIGEAALTYFHQSEQLPSFVRLAVARHYKAGEKGAPGRWQWRAGGLMIQHLARSGGTEAAEEEVFEEDDEAIGVEDDDWERTRILASTVEDHELLDPMLPPDRLLYRLFHEEGVRAFPAAPIEAYCRCSRERVEGFLRSFGAGRTLRHARARWLDQRHVRVLRQEVPLRPRRDRLAALSVTAAPGLKTAVSPSAPTSAFPGNRRSSCARRRRRCRRTASCRCRARPFPGSR